MTDAFDTWRRSLAGEQVPLDVNVPYCGYFRVRDGKGGPLIPVGIFPNDFGDPVMLRNNEPTILDRIWPWAAKAPVTEEAYETAIRTGKWPDMDATVASNLADPAASLKDEIASAKAGAAAYAKIADDATMAAAQSLRARLLELSGQAKSTHKRLKAPHWEKCQKIDREWLGLARDAEGAAITVRIAMEAWEDAKRKAAADATAAEQARLDAARKAAEDEAREMGATDAVMSVLAMPIPAAPLVSAPAALRRVKGAYGKAANVGTKQVVTIVDIDNVFAVFREHEDVRAVLQKLAQQAVDNGSSVAGITIEAKARIK